MTTIKIKSSDLRELARALKREEGWMLNYADACYRRNLTTMFERIVNQTPQFSGQLVQNWQVSIGAVGSYSAMQGNDYWDKFSPETDTPFKMGDTENTEEPLNTGKSIISYAHYLGAPVFFYNTTPYAEDVDDGRGPTDDHGTSYSIRAVNLIDGIVQMLAANVSWAKTTGTWRE